MATRDEIVTQYLHTPRLTLELYDHSPSHFNCFLSAVHSPTAHKSMGNNGLHTLDEFDASNAASRLRHPKFNNGVCDDDIFYLLRLGHHAPDGPLIGIVSLSQREGRAVDMGWAVCEGFMGRGFATEAAGEVLRWVREDLGVEEVIVLPSETNEASNRVAEKLGFVAGGKVPHERVEGKMRNVFVLSKKGSS